MNYLHYFLISNDLDYRFDFWSFKYISNIATEYSASLHIHYRLTGVIAQPYVDG